MSDDSSSYFTQTFDPSVYRLSAIKKAAYRFGDRGAGIVDTLPDGHIRVVFAARNRSDSLDELKVDFCNEVLDQELRETIAAETSQVRDLLLAQAFSGISVTDSASESADFESDPLKISQSQV